MSSQLLSGAVDMLILEVVSHGDSYGYQITQEVLSRSAGYFEFKEGSLYPALHRMEKRGLLSSEWDKTSNGRRARFYRLTAEGQAQLAGLKQRWEDSTWAVHQVMHVAAIDPL